MAPTSTVRRSLAVLALGALLVAPVACSSDDDSDTSTGTTVPAATGDTAATDDGAETTATTEATSTTPGEPSTSATSVAEPTTESTATAAPVTLRLDGVGPTTIGQPADATVDLLSEALGEPSGTQPWVQPSCELAGTDSDGARSVSWGGLTISLRGSTEAGATFEGWTYTGSPAGTATELRLDSGIGIGNPGDDLAEAYGAAATFVPFEMFDAHWEVTDGDAMLWAIVDGDAAGAPISRMDLNPAVCE